MEEENQTEEFIDDNLAPDVDFDGVPDANALLPIAEYYAVLNSIEPKKGKIATTVMVNYSMKIVSGKYKGRMIFDNIVYRHADANVAERGMSNLKELLVANGVKSFSMRDAMDPSVGGRRIQRIKVGINPAKDGYDERNSVKRCFWINDEEIERVLTGTTETTTEGKAASFMSRKKNDDLPF
jgi:hypothetical protein